jgi:hypothetical protein
MLRRRRRRSALPAAARLRACGPPAHPRSPHLRCAQSCWPSARPHRRRRARGCEGGGRGRVVVVRGRRGAPRRCAVLCCAVLCGPHAAAARARAQAHRRRPTAAGRARAPAARRERAGHTPRRGSRRSGAPREPARDGAQAIDCVRGARWAADLVSRIKVPVRSPQNTSSRCGTGDPPAAAIVARPRREAPEADRSCKTGFRTRVPHSWDALRCRTRRGRIPDRRRQGRAFGGPLRRVGGGGPMAAMRRDRGRREYGAPRRGARRKGRGARRGGVTPGGVSSGAAFECGAARRRRGGAAPRERGVDSLRPQRRPRALAGRPSVAAAPPPPQKFTPRRRG